MLWVKLFIVNKWIIYSSIRYRV